MAGDLAIVTGSMTEVNPAGEEKLFYVRVYIKRAGRWQLLSSAQLMPPGPKRTFSAPKPRVVAERLHC